MKKQPDITISIADLTRIESQLEHCDLPGEFIDALEGELARANVLPIKEMPSGVVTLESQVTFKVVATESTFTKTLCLPAEANKYEDSISLFAPIGSAIIGLSEGQQITWNIQGKSQVVEIVSVNKVDTN